MHPLLVRASVPLVASNFLPSSSHYADPALLMHRFQQKLHQNQGQPPPPTARGEQPSLLTGTDPSCAHLPWQHPVPAQPSSPPMGPQPTPGCPQQKPAGTSSHLARQGSREPQQPPLQQSSSHQLPKHGVETPTGPVMLPQTLLALHKSWLLTKLQGLIQKSKGNSSKVHSSKRHSNPPTVATTEKCTNKNVNNFISCLYTMFICIK